MTTERWLRWSWGDASWQQTETYAWSELIDASQNAICSDHSIQHAPSVYDRDRGPGPITRRSFPREAFPRDDAQGYVSARESQLRAEKIGFLCLSVRRVSRSRSEHCSVISARSDTLCYNNNNNNNIYYNTPILIPRGLFHGIKIMQL